MAPSIIYCAPIPFNIVFHNANKGKMRINVLDLSRFCCAPGRERTNAGRTLASPRSFPITACNYHAKRCGVWRIRYFVSFDASEKYSRKCTLRRNHATIVSVLPTYPCKMFRIVHFHQLYLFDCFISDISLGIFLRYKDAKNIGIII